MRGFVFFITIVPYMILSGGRKCTVGMNLGVEQSKKV
jgi:hypothetical protein